MHLCKAAIGLGLVLSSMLVDARQPSDSTLLSSVKSLTLYDGKKTSHRRVSAIPQLKCVGGNGRGLYTVDVMRCQNSGSDYDREDVQWTCQASLPPEFKLGSTDVICEGYDSPDDPRILKGSCGVEYRLILTKLGEEVYGSRGRSKHNDYSSSGKSNSLFSLLFWLAFIGVVLLIVYRFFVPVDGPNGQRRPNNRRPGGFGGGGGGGGWDGHDDPPPPYTPRGFGSKPSSSRYSQSNWGSSSTNAWRPGFWSGAATGAATGAAAGYMAGRRGGNNSLGGNQWYGSGRSGPSGGGSSMGSSSSSSSNTRYESTGFGGTTRR